MKRTKHLLIILALCGTAAQAQWTSDPDANNRITPEGQLDYGTRDVVTDGNGRTYIVSVTADDPTLQSYRLQIVDDEGRLTMPENGLEISTYRTLSYTTVNQKLLVDRDGNAIVITHDCRNAAPGTTAIGYTAYKVSPDGTMLWGSSGVDLDGGGVHYGSALMNAVQTTDGGYVFAYTVWDENNKEEVHVEKLTADGEAAWDILLTDTDRSYSTPYVVDTGDNQIMLFYLSGTNQDIMARLLDFDGSSVWNEDTTVYRGGFDSTPAYTFIDVWQAPEGGAFITWRDDRYYEGSYSNYISYVKNDGSLGFPGGSDALKISYADDLSRMNPQIVYDEGQQCIFAVYRQFYQSAQSYNGISMQKISLDGELLWGSEGKAVVDVSNEKYAAYASVQLAGGSDIAVFWQTQSDDEVVMSYAMKYDTDGNPLWGDEPLSFTTTASNKNSLQSSPLIDESYWLLRWNDYRDHGEGNHTSLYMQRINADGTLGTPETGISDVTAAVTADPSVTVYDVTGKKIAILPSVGCINETGLGSGLYIIKDNASGIAYKTLIK